MTVSLFTPTNNTKWLPELYESLKTQTDPEFEWVILYNNGAVPIKGLWDNDCRVKVSCAYNAPEWVGYLKSTACELCTGEILAELDHDDLLMPTAIEEIKKAFTENPDCGFCYSNTVHSDEHFNKIQRFSSYFGWSYRKVEYKDCGGEIHILDEHISFPPTPESLSRIWFSPNHIRCFRRSLYDEVGGYNKEMRVLDDHDIECRMYLKTEFYHINKPLYVYRVHGANSWIKYNAEIQNNVYRIYDQYIESLVERSCELRGLRKVELGGRIAAKAGYETVDLKDADIICNLNQRWPFPDSSVGVVRAFDVFEHLRNSIHTMKELYRVLAPGGFAFIQVPSTDGTGAFSDPTHCSFWNERSFKYYTEARLNKYIECPVRFQAPRLFTTEKDSEGVCWVKAHLISCKDNYRPCGSLDI